MPAVEWRRGRFKTTAHAVVDGDLLTLCGQLAEALAYAETEPRVIQRMACPACREIAEKLVAPLVEGVATDG